MTRADRVDRLVFSALFAALRETQLEPRPERRLCAAAFAAAEHAGVGGVFARGLPAPPGPTAASAAGVARARAQLAAGMMIQYSRECATAALRRAGVAHVVLKGALHDPWLYGGRGERRATDVDLLVAPEDEAAAARALVGLGYERVRFPSHPVTNDVSKERLFRSPEVERCAVDLHVGLVNAPPYRDFTRAALSRSREWTTVCGPIRGLSREDALVHLAGNLGADRFFARTLLSLDAAVLLDRGPIDWDAVVSLARWSGCDVALWALLAIVRSRLPVVVDECALAALAPPQPIRRAVERAVGVHAAPRNSAGRLLSLLLIEWPLSGRAAWPATAAGRWAALRLRDRWAVRREAISGA